MITAADAEDDAAAADLLASIDRRLASLQEWSLVELAQCKGPLSLQAELTGQVNGDLAVVDGLVEDLALLAEQHPSPRRRLDIIEQCSQRSSQLESLRSKVRDATLASRRRIQASNTSSMRAELFSSNASAQRNPSKGETRASKDDELMSATSNVTAGLRRTRQLMEQELERSVLSTQMLERSSQTLTLTSNQYTSFSDVLSASKKLITALEKADVLDRLLITAALIFFFLVCLLIIKRRIIDRGVRAVSLAGRVAGGVGGVATRGAKAMLAHESTDQVKASASSLAQSVTTALASAGTALASVTAAPESWSSTAPSKSIRAGTENLNDALSTEGSEQIKTADTTSLPITLGTEAADVVDTTASTTEYDSPVSTPIPATIFEVAQSMVDDVGSESSDNPAVLTADHAQLVIGLQDTSHDADMEADFLDDPLDEPIIFEDAATEPPIEEGEPTVSQDAAHSPQDPRSQLQHDDPGVEEAETDQAVDKKTPEIVEDGPLAAAYHDEL